MRETVATPSVRSLRKPLAMSLPETARKRPIHNDLAQRLCDQGFLLGRVLERAMQLSGRTPKELAAEFDFADSSAISRMVMGQAPFRFNLLWSVEWMRTPLLIALAESMGTEATVQHVITLTRRAG